MASRMNYGRRFRSSAVSVYPTYDRTVHKGMVPPQFINLDDLSHSWAGCLGSASHSANTSHCYLGKPVKIDERFEAEKRLILRVNQCIDVLIFGVQEVATTPLAKPHSTSAINQKTVIDLIEKMCKIVARQAPEWGIYRRPGIAMVRRCIDCGTELAATEKERCPMCQDNSLDRYKQRLLEKARDDRLAKRDLERQVKSLQRMLRRIEQRAEKNAGHSGHQSEDASVMEAGGSEQDQRVRSETSHRDCARDPRHAESGNDGVAFESESHPSGSNQTAPPAQSDDDHNERQIETKLDQGTPKETIR
jgi:hypothetical protein